VNQAELNLAGFNASIGIDHYRPTLPIINIIEGRNGAPDTAVIWTNVATTKPGGGEEIVIHSVGSGLERSGGKWIVKTCDIDPSL
jgi:hypothetical protein